MGGYLFNFAQNKSCQYIYSHELPCQGNFSEYSQDYFVWCKKNKNLL